MGLCRKAAKHYCGAGLEQGANFKGMAKQIAFHREKGEEREARLLEVFASGAAWFGDRYLEAGAEELALCKCGQKQTARHAIWDCKLLEKEEDPRIKKIQWLRQHVSDDFLCFWARGIPNKDPEQNIWGDDWRWKAGDQSLWTDFGPDTVRASDGSGGKRSSDPVLARMGWASVVVKFWPSSQRTSESIVRNWAALCGGIDGKQTVPRAEAKGCEVHVSQSNGVSFSNVFDANSAIANGKSKTKALNSSLADIWRDALEKLEAEKSHMQLLKVKSHASAQEILEADLPVEHLVANEFADVFADWAAERRQVDEATANMRDTNERTSWLVRERIIAVGVAEAADHSARTKVMHLREKERKEKRREQQQIAEQNPQAHQHLVQQGLLGVYCLRCRQGPGRNMQKSGRAPFALLWRRRLQKERAKHWR